MDGVLDGAALVLTAAGLAAGAVVAAVTRSTRAGLGTALELWLAAGLLRLAAPATWTGIAVAAAVVAVRRLVGGALLRAQASTTNRASTSSPPGVRARNGAGSSPGSVPP